jgi:4-hydroxy-tetrahydrodipicolinate reductase
MQACERIAPWMDCQGIDEEHHPGKRDAPSGTARATAERIARAARPPAAPPISPLRREGVLATQRVVFGSGPEQLVLEHRVTDRAAYLPGVWLALRRVRTLTGLLRGLDALLAP